MAGATVLGLPAVTDERDAAPAPHTQRGPFQISRTQAGRYSIADEAGRSVGTIWGDHVIGYTVRTEDRTWRFRDLDAVREALELDLQLEAELHARERAPERAASGVA